LPPYNKFEIVQLQREELAAKSNASSKITVCQKEYFHSQELDTAILPEIRIYFAC